MTNNESKTEVYAKNNLKETQWNQTRSKIHDEELIPDPFQDREDTIYGKPKEQSNKPHQKELVQQNYK